MLSYLDPNDHEAETDDYDVAFVEPAPHIGAGDLEWVVIVSRVYPMRTFNTRLAHAAYAYLREISTADRVSRIEPAWCAGLAGRGGVAGSISTPLAMSVHSDGLRWSTLTDPSVTIRDARINKASRPTMP